MRTYLFKGRGRLRCTENWFYWTNGLLRCPLTKCKRLRFLTARALLRCKHVLTACIHNCLLPIQTILNNIYSQENNLVQKQIYDLYAQYKKMTFVVMESGTIRHKFVSQCPHISALVTSLFASFPSSCRPLNRNKIKHLNTPP